MLNQHRVRQPWQPRQDWVDDRRPGPTRPPATRARNAADVAFATGMIPHHAQAVEMADMALTQATDA